MNNKQIACTILGLCIGLMLWFTLKSHGKMTAMQTEASQAEMSAMAADSKRSMKDIELVRFSRENAPLLDYLAAWKPYFDQTDTPDKAEGNLTTQAKESGLVIFTQGFTVNSTKDAKLIGKILRMNVTFESPYSRSLQWIGYLEEAIPTSRVSGCTIKKGENDDDIRMELVIELPVIGNETDAIVKS